MSKIIAVIRNYKNVGFVISPFFFEQKNKHFIDVTEIVTPEIAEKNGGLSDDELSVIKSADAYSDKNLTKIFGKKQKINDFFKNLTEEDINKRIRPFIEKQLVILIDKIKKNGIPLYFKKDKFSTLYPEDEVKIKNASAEAVFNIEKHNEGTKYYLSVSYKNNAIKLYGKDKIILSDMPCVMVIDNNLYFFEDIDAKKLIPFFTKEYISVPPRNEKKWFETFAVKAMKNYKVNPRGFLISEKKEDFKTLLILEKDWKNEYAFILKFIYESGTYQYGKKYDTKLIFNEKEFSFLKIIRNTQAEKEILEKIKQTGLEEQNGGAFKIKGKFKIPDKQHYETISFLEKNKNYFAKNGIEIKQNFFGKKYFTEKITHDIKIKNGKDWFDIYGTVKFGKFEIPFINLKNNILNGIKEFELPDGSFAVIPDEWFEKYSDLFLLGNEGENGIKIGKTHFTVIEKTGVKGIDASYKESFKKLLNPENEEAEIPKNLNAELREYQKQGFKRMKFLRDAGFGVCLADDMGLGKTLQTVTLLLDTVNGIKKSGKTKENPKKQKQLSLFGEPDRDNTPRKPSLVVMPVSLIYNWFDELKKFAPELKVLKYAGAGRQKNIPFFDEYDVILAGYATVRNDIDKFSEIEFLYVILDESQFVKNPDSKTYKAVLELNSEYKAVLTGTPVENSLSDLWSQMNFINNGMLGDYNFFKETFIKPIEKNKDKISEEKLKSIAGPFIIRRTKEEVAKDLPELTEQIIYCEASEKQKSLYETEKSKIRNEILEKENPEGKKKLSAEILAALMKLRLISNHPVLTDPNYDDESGKFNEVVRNLENVISENHKVLIFSSFVKHLEIFAEYLSDKGVEYSVLTGKTKNRKEVVKEFQENEKNKVFLISLKAGGTGLNLTCADYVFILDPWWNPAAEKQAVNRAHRIGQKRNVFVYKYITKNTVEEKILNLQKEKKMLADSVISGDGLPEKFSEEVLLNLFE